MSSYLRIAPLFLLSSAAFAITVKLSDQTRQAYDSYVKQVDGQMDSVVLGRLPEVRASVMKGEIVAMPFAFRKDSASASVPIIDGLVNHWLGAMFVPNTTVERVRSVLQNYGQYSRIYAPDVTESKIVKGGGDEFDVFLRLHRQVRVKALFGYTFPVEFNTNYHIRYYQAGETLRVRSVASRIAEVRDPKKSHAEEYEVGNDEGYLWQLQSNWRLYAGQGGVFVECEAISLSRSVPGFVERMVTYFTTNFPEESMRATLKATRDAVR